MKLYHLKNLGFYLSFLVALSTIHAEILQTSFSIGVNSPKSVSQISSANFSVDSYDITPYGEAIDTNTFIPFKSTRLLNIDSNPFIYGQAYFDNESGFNYMKARYQNPILMRFISQDSEDLKNRYAYGNGDPINNFDPSGHNPVRYVFDAIQAMSGIVMGIFSFGSVPLVVAGGLEIFQASSSAFLRAYGSMDDKVGGISMGSISDAIQIISGVSSISAIAYEWHNALSIKKLWSLGMLNKSEVTEESIGNYFFIRKTNYKSHFDVLEVNNSDAKNVVFKKIEIMIDPFVNLEEKATINDLYRLNRKISESEFNNFLIYKDKDYPLGSFNGRRVSLHFYKFSSSKFDYSRFMKNVIGVKRKGNDESIEKYSTKIYRNLLKGGYKYNPYRSNCRIVPELILQGEAI